MQSDFQKLFCCSNIFYTTNQTQAKNIKNETQERETQNAQGESETQEREQKAETAQEVKARAKSENENETRADKVLADENASLQEKVQAISDEASDEYVKAFNPDFDLFQTETAELRALSEVRSLYEKTPLWMKAPNGSDTKLSEKQWLQVRTPQFKKWFGDWEAVAKKKAIEKLKAIEATPISNVPDFFTSKKTDNRKQQLAWANEQVKNRTVQSKIGEVHIFNSGIRNSIYHGANKYKAATFSILDKLIENSVVVQNANEKNNLDFVLASKVLLDGKESIAGIVIKQGKDGKKYYSHTIIQKERETTHRTAEAVGNRRYHPATDTILHNILSVNEKDVSKVIDENGEPLVVYHNTAEYFDTFDISKARQNADIPAFFFSTGKNDWQDMGDVLVQAFLDIKNLVEKPIVTMNGREIRDSLVEKNIDGTISADEDETEETEYAVFNSNQIKSATDNTGAFRKDDNSILFQTETDISAEFADVAKGENVAKKVEDALNALIGEAIDTHSPPLQIEVTKENKAHVKHPNVTLRKDALQKHNASLLALEKIINNAVVDNSRNGTVDLSHNTRKKTLKHKTNVLEYVYFNSLAKINDEFFTVALTTERVKNQNENLLDLYNVRIKKEAYGTRPKDTSAASSINNVSANSQNVKSKNENLLGDILFQTEASVYEKIDSIIEIAKSNDNKKAEITLGNVGNDFIENAKMHNLDIADYAHTIDSYSIRHILREHGNALKEKKRGNVALTENDIKQIPKILQSPDYIIYGAKTKQNLDSVIFVRNNNDGSSIFIEEVRTKQKTLATKTMYKIAVASDADTLKRNPSLYVQNDNGVISIIDVKKDFVNTERVKNQNENLLGDILFQTEEDLMRDARFWGSWQEFKEFYDTGILSKEEMSQVPSDADARWYETVWEKAKGIRPTLDETQAEKIEVRYGAEKGNANDMDAYFETMLETKKGMLENFLKRIAEIKNEKLIANPQDESEVQFNDALLAKQQFINTRLRHASIVLNAERVLRGKELTVRAKRFFYLNARAEIFEKL